MLKSKRKINLELPHHVSGPSLRMLHRREQESLDATLSYPSQPVADVGLITEGPTALHAMLDGMPDVRSALRAVLRRMVVDNDRYGPLYSAILTEYNTVVDEYAHGTLANTCPAVPQSAGGQRPPSPVPIVQGGLFCHVSDNAEVTGQLTRVVADIEALELENKVLRVQVQETLYENQKLQRKLLEKVMQPMPLEKTPVMKPKIGMYPHNKNFIQK